MVAATTKIKPVCNAESSDSGPETFASDALFKEPEGYYKPEKAPTSAEHALLDGRTVKLGLVGESPLWVGLGFYMRCLSFCIYFFPSRRKSAFNKISILKNGKRERQPVIS